MDVNFSTRVSRLLLQTIRELATNPLRVSVTFKSNFHYRYTSDNTLVFFKVCPVSKEKYQ